MRFEHWEIFDGNWTFDDWNRLVRAEERSGHRRW